MHLITSHPPCFNIIAEQHHISHPEMNLGKYCTCLKIPLHRHFYQGSGKLEKNQQVENWVRGAINWMLSTQVQYSTPIFSMAKSKGKSTDTSSTKSSTLSSKAESLKQSVKHGAKVFGRPFKKLKTSIATAVSSCSTHSHSIVLLPTSKATPFKNSPIKINGSQSDGTSHNNSVELGPKEELGSYLYDSLFMLTLISF